MERFGENFKHTIDALSLTAIVTTLAGWLPPIAALLSIIWYLILIFEKVTGKKIADRRKKPR